MQQSELLAGSWLESSRVAQTGVGVSSLALKEDWNVRQRRGGRARWAWDSGTDITLGMMLTPWGAYRCCSDASCKSENGT